MTIQRASGQYAVMQGLSDAEQDLQTAQPESTTEFEKNPKERSMLRGVRENRERILVVRPMENDEDIEAIWPLCQSFHRESRYRNIKIDKVSLKKSIRKNCLENPSKCGIYIAELRGEPVGFLGCMMSRLLYTEYWSASALIFYVLPECRKTLVGGRVALKLLNYYRAWAKQRKALEIQIHVTHGFDLERVNKFLNKMGFRLCGGNYSLEI